MSWIKAIAVISLSSLLAFIFVEYSYRAVKGNSSGHSFTKRIMLFQAGNNFLNHDGYFTYVPNAKIRSLGLFSTQNPKLKHDIKIEYDYVIRTNNAGLVMQTDLIPSDRVLFVIGDSFTEGQGASAWFYDLEEDYNVSPIKPVNLGILGTGPQQWENLSKSVSKQFDLTVEGSVVNIIPDDMNRGIWTFEETELNCLAHISCDYNFGFQGYDFKLQETDEDIKLSVLQTLTENKLLPADENSSTALIKQYVKRSHVVFDLHNAYTMNFRRYNPLPNQDSLIALKKAVADNFYVNVVSMKTVNSANFLSYRFARELIGFLEKNDIKYSWCDIPDSGYHIIDGHPNDEGYKVLRSCTEDALAKLIK
jgi:hypothetical protein